MMTDENFDSEYHLRRAARYLELTDADNLPMGDRQLFDMLKSDLATKLRPEKVQ